MTGFLRKLGQKFGRRRIQKEPKQTVNDILMQRAVEASADFIEPLLSSTLLFNRAEKVREFAISRAPGEGLLMEFGVYRGGSINQFAEFLAEHDDRREIHGFDAFLGLSEDWFGKGLPKKSGFSRGGATPRVRPNVKLVIGWVEDTLKPFLEAHPGPVAFMHIDTDTYTPCKLILSLCQECFVDGTIVLFDEHHGFPNWKNGEFKALHELLRPNDFEYLAFGSQQAVIRIKRGA